MMKLSTMKKVVETVDDKWESPLAGAILDRWGYDPGTIKFFRASANFVFIFKREEKRYFLRFNDASERDLSRIESEIVVLRHLQNNSLRVAKPIKSINDHYIESVVFEDSTYHAVVFEALSGQQYDFEELENDQFFTWGKSLGQLHSFLKKVPDHLSCERSTWEDHLNFVRESLPESELGAKRELECVLTWASGLTKTNENFGIIHYDFECDNLCWEEQGISILDFDDCGVYWFVADIAYALRELYEDGINPEHPAFQTFIEGYKSETDIDVVLLQNLSWFMRLHDLVSFAKLLRSVDIPDLHTQPEWLTNLRNKLILKIENYRKSFERNIEVKRI